MTSHDRREEKVKDKGLKQCQGVKSDVDEILADLYHDIGKVWVKRGESVKVVEGEKREAEIQVSVDKYQGMYNMEVVRQLEMRVEEIVIFIPEINITILQLVAVKAEKVGRENLVEVGRIVRKWFDGSPQTNTADVVTGKTDRDLDILLVEISPPLFSFLSRQNCPLPPPLNLTLTL